jgi:signal transduction histidine kinase
MSSREHSGGAESGLVPAYSGTEQEAADLAEYQSAIRDATRLNRLFAILSEPADLASVVDRVLLALSEMFAADVVTLLHPVGSGQLTTAGAIGLPEDMVGRPFSGAAHSYAAAAIHGLAPVLVENALDDPRLDSQLKELGIETAAFLPLLGSQEVLAVLVLARCQPLPFSRSDADLLTAMAYRIAVLLERTRAEEERRTLESRLRQAEKAESLGRMAAAIAHHLNNKLTAVMGFLDLALEELASGRDARADIGRSQDAARQAAKVGHLMLAYLGAGHDTPEKLDLVVACREALPEVVGALPEPVHLRAEFPARVLMVTASRPDIRQVLANLVANAEEAMAGREGEIVVAIHEVQAAEIAPAPLHSPGWTPTGRYACLEVADAGSGMDAATLQNAFDPFFTTKFVGRGLGLPVVLGVVRAHAGTVTVSSRPGRGSTFRVYLPLTSEESP